MTSANFPDHGTQTARLLNSLLSGEAVNPLQAWRRHGIYRLSDVVFKLRQLGWPVTTDRLDVMNKYGEPCHVASYSLSPDVIREAGGTALEFVATMQRLEAERRVA